MYSHLRFATAASLIAFGGVIGIGVPALLVFTVEGPLVAKTDISDSPAAPCKQQTWLLFDRNCLSKRDLPWTVGRAGPNGGTNGGTTEAKAEPDPAPDQPLTDSRHAAAALQEPVPQEAMSSTPISPAPRSWEPVARKSTPPDFVLQGLAPQEPGPQKPASQEPVTKEPATLQPAAQEAAAQPPAPRSKQAARVAPRTANVEQRVTKPTTETQARLPAAKKPIRSSRIAKRSTNEALSIVRRFEDSPRDVPANAYAGNGTRLGNKPGLPLDIRPTSIQDVYYYSIPR